MARFKIDKKKAAESQDLLDLNEKLKRTTNELSMSYLGLNLSPIKAFLLYVIYFIGLFTIFCGINRIPEINYYLQKQSDSSGEITAYFKEFSWFKMADISQANYKIVLPPDDIKSIEITYESITDFSYFSISPDKMTHHSIFFNNKDKIAQIQIEGLNYYVSFPEMRNIQVVRSFFITALLALFLQECFKHLSKYLLDESKTEEKNENLKKDKRQIPD